MVLTYGFYNSRNSDRVYNAQQLASIFDGIIEDGVYQSIGDTFVVRTTEDTSDTEVLIGTGRAWFNHTWTLNDAPYILDLGPAEVLFDRYDTVFLEVDSTVGVRENSFKVARGAPGESPVYPVLTNADGVYQYPLAHVLRKANQNKIMQENISNMVGSASTPFVVGVLESLNIENLLLQWSGQWNSWFRNETNRYSDQFDNWRAGKQIDFNTWFTALQVVLEGNVATNLASQIMSLEDMLMRISRDMAITHHIQDADGDNVTDAYGSAITGQIMFAVK